MVAGERFSGCGMNKDSTESGEKMHEIVEGYAADNNNFIQVWPKTQSFLCLLPSFFFNKVFLNIFQNREKANRKHAYGSVATPELYLGFLQGLPEDDFQRIPRQQ